MGNYTMTDGGDGVRMVSIVRAPDESMSPDQEDGMCKERVEAFNQNEWEYVGIRAEAEIVVANTVQTIRSGGLWGVESDNDEAYLREVAGEEHDALETILAKMNFPILPWAKVHEGMRLLHKGVVHAIPDRGVWLYPEGRRIADTCSCGTRFKGTIAYGGVTCLACLAS